MFPEAVSASRMSRLIQMISALLSGCVERASGVTCAVLGMVASLYGGVDRWSPVSVLV